MSQPLLFWVNEDQKESSEKRVARFKQWFNRSRIGQLLKDERYHKKEKTKREIRKAALMRAHYRKEREHNKFYQ